jgi:hypothetical protein
MGDPHKAVRVGVRLFLDLSYSDRKPLKSGLRGLGYFFPEFSAVGTQFGQGMNLVIELINVMDYNTNFHPSPSFSVPLSLT